MKLTTDEVLTRGVAEILPTKKALTLLMESKKITLYQGFDPSMPSLHLGNYVGLLKLSQFQRLGHKVIFLVGDFSGMIGDPTDKKSTRKKLTRKETLENAKTWKEQAGKILRFDGDNKAEIVFNSKWLDTITFKELIEITSHFTFQQMIERDMFQERIKRNEPIHLHEFLYPIATAIDCVELNVDLEIGGSDQLFNILVGRTLMKTVKGKEKFVLGTKLLVDKDGNKVGKTTGNALFLSSKPSEFFAGIMSFPDETIYLSFELLTEVDLEGLKEKISEDPMNEKKNLAFEVVKIIYGEKDAEKAKKDFENTFQRGAIEDSAEDFVLGNNPHLLLDVIAIKIASKSEAKRLLSQNAIEVNGKVIKDAKFHLNNGDILKIGKKLFYKIIY